MPRVALVIGANQGLGLALVKGLCAALAVDDTVYLTARSPQRGEAAVRSLGAVTPHLRFAQLDVADETSVADVADMLRARHGGVDIVISNAAARIGKEVSDAEQVAGFIETNNHGTRRMLAHTLALLKPNGRFVVVASSFGRLSQLPAHLHARFDTGTASLADIEATMDAYVAAVEGGGAAAEGWPDWINIPSKVGQVASARIAARMITAQRPDDGILINAACPGLVDTAASRPWFDDMSAAQSPDAAAVDVLWLALLPAGSTAPHGELVRFREPLPWL